MRKTHRARLRDILDEIDAVAELVEGVDLAGYRKSRQLRRAVERSVEIISEASRHIPAALKDKHADQPWPEIAGVGNLLRHDYNRVDDFIMWKIATRSLPALRPVIVALLAEEQP